MQLYTSLVHLKQATNDGRLPPMTPIPESAMAIIDPTFTIGLGAVREDATLGLQCPVRDCGKYYHNLGNHIARSHKSIGGQNAVKDMLEIPRRAKLLSATAQATYVAAAKAKWETNGAKMRAARRPMHLSARPKRQRQLAGIRNRSNECEAQQAQDMIDLQNKLRRSPSVSEFIAEYGENRWARIREHYGTWNAFKAKLGMRIHQRDARMKSTKDFVFESLAAWYDVHGSLPSSAQAMRPDRTPVIPSVPSVYRALGTKSWPHAMRIVASVLNIYGGRYGLPEKKSA